MCFGVEGCCVVAVRCRVGDCSSVRMSSVASTCSGAAVCSKEDETSKLELGCGVGGGSGRVDGPEEEDSSGAVVLSNVAGYFDKEVGLVVDG